MPQVPIAAGPVRVSHGGMASGALHLNFVRTSRSLGWLRSQCSAALCLGVVLGRCRLMA